MKIHICLVSDQTLANLIPALMERPDKVILVASAEMKQRGRVQHLINALSERNLSAETLDDAPDTSLNEIRRYADALRAALSDSMPDAAITLNATGGTKLMMLGFVEAFRQRAVRTIYVDTAHRRIEEIGGEETIMENVLDVRGYLAAQGIRIDRVDSDDELRRDAIEKRAELTRFIGENIVKLQGGIKILNGILAKAIEKIPGTRQDQLAKPDFELQHGAWGDFEKLLVRCNALHLVEWERNGKSGRFVDLESARYLSGIWLEEYAWLCAHDCQPFDAHMGVHRAGHNDEEINEFDLLAVHGNQLLFVECKTANFQNKINQANQTAYKLDSLSRLARGLFGETWLLSAIEPPQELLDRTRELRIRVLGPQELSNLGLHIAGWMKC